MRSKQLFLLANLAAYALAFPTDLSFDRRAPNLGIGADLHVNLGPFLSGAIDLNIFVGLDAKGAAALEGCAMGAKAGRFDADAKKQLHDWLNSSSAVQIDVDLKTSVLNWCTGDDSSVLDIQARAGASVYIPALAQIAAKGGLIVTIDGILEDAERAVLAVLDPSARASLLSFLSGKAGAALDPKVKSALHLVAAGGLVSSLTEDVKAALEAFLNSAESALDAQLKSNVLAWLKGTIGGAVVALDNLVDTALASISIGSAIASRVDPNGALNAAAQASLLGFLHDVADKLDDGIKKSLELAAKGQIATALSPDAHVALSKWLASVDCTLTAELKGVVMYWLTVGVAVHDTVTLALDEVTKVTAFLTGTVGQSASAAVRGAIAVAAAGSSIADLTLDTVAELASFLAGVGVNIDDDIKAILVHWMTGCSCSTKASGSVDASKTGLPAVSGVPAASAAAAVSGVPTVSGIPNVPSGAANAPSVPGLSNILPGGPMIPSVPVASNIPSGSIPNLPSGAPKLSNLNLPNLPNLGNLGNIPSGVSGNTNDLPAVPSMSAVPVAANTKDLPAATISGIPSSVLSSSPATFSLTKIGNKKCYCVEE